MAFDDTAPTADELQRAQKKLKSLGVPSTGPTAPKPQSDLDAPPTQEELNLARSGGASRLSPEQAAELARQQGFDASSRGVAPSFLRGAARTALMAPAFPVELGSAIGQGLTWSGHQIANWIDPRNPIVAWKDIPGTADTPYLRNLGAKSLYDNVVGPEALNIFPHRRPDETGEERAAGTLGELAGPAILARGVGMRAVDRSAGPVMQPATVTGRPRPYVSQADAARARAQINRAAVAETALGVAGSEVGRSIDLASGGDGSKGQAIGSIAAPLAPMVASAAGTTTKFVLRGGERGRREIADAIAASDSLDDAAGRTYRPTGTQRVLDVVGGGSGRPVNLTAGQAAPRAGLVRTIERLAAYFPGGYPVLAKRIASQLENARDTVTALADRAVERFNRQAGAENASRRSRQSYQMQTQGRYATNALDETIPTVGGLNDEAAGQAIDRGLRERVAMNENLRRLAEAEFEARMPRDTQIGMNSTINTLEALEARLPDAPSVSTGTLRSPVIGNLRDELINDAVNAPNGGVTIPFEVLRRVRTRVGEFLNGDTRALGPAGMGEADARRLYAALTEDMATAARDAGPDVWLSWQTAQAVTRSGAEVASDVRQVLNRQTMEGVEAALASGEGSRVRDAMAAMPQRDRDLVVANIFRKWGEAKPGQQDAEGVAWSFNRWLTNVNEARQRGSFEALTGTSAREMTEAINALNTVAGRVKARADFMPNNSGSGRIITSTNTLLGAAATAPIDMGLSAAITATGIVAPNLMARLTTNPRFIRWLARTAETPPHAMAGHLLRLGTFANNPETAAGVREFTNAFMTEFEKGDALDRAAMIDPTPISETARQVRSYVMAGPEGQAPKEFNAGNVLASAGAIGLAALGLGGGKAAQLRGAFNLSARNLSKFEAKFAADMEAAVAKGKLPEVTERYAKFIAEAKQYATQENNQEALARLTALEQRAAAAGQQAAVPAAPPVQQTPNEVYGDGISDAASTIKYDDQGHWADLEGALQRTRQAESEHTIGAERTQRQTASTKVRPGDQAAIDKALRAARLVTDTTVKNEAGEKVVKTTLAKGAKAVEEQIKAAIREVRDRFPEADGWQAITPSKIAIKRDRKGATQIVIEEWKAADGYNLTGGFRKGTPEYQKRVLKAADKGVQAVLGVLARAAAGDKAAQTIIRQMGWYREFTKKGFDTYGGSMPMVRDMLGASSPNTPVWMNYVFSQKGARALSQGEFDDSMRALADDMTGNTGPNAVPDAIKIRQPTGSLFGMNSGNMMNAIRERWLSKEPGQAPKARQFSGNLGGLDLRATIDVWAARFTNRMVGGKRVPIPAEAGVAGSLDAKGMFSTGDFGFGQAVFANMAARLNKSGALKSELKKLGYNHITPADLQALTWFIEKEHWTKNNWTSAAGEGGSFEQMMDLDPLVRHQAGFSIQRDAPPSDANVMQARNVLERALSSEKDVRMFRAHPTRGQYGQDVERSFDLEVVAKPGWDQAEYRRKVVQMAKDNGQKDVFFSRRLSPSEASTNPNARPGVEIYTRGRLTPAEMDGIMQQFREAGIDGFTFVTEHRKAERLMGGSDPATYHGLRLQVIPEFEMMFDDAARASFAKDPAALDKYLKTKLSKMLDVIDGLQGNPRIVDARTHHYDTEVIHQTEYDDFLAGGNAWGGAGANEAGAGRAGSGGQGRSRYENAARRDRALGKR